MFFVQVLKSEINACYYYYECHQPNLALLAGSDQLTQLLPNNVLSDSGGKSCHVTSVLFTQEIESLHDQESFFDFSRSFEFTKIGISKSEENHHDGTV